MEKHRALLKKMDTSLGEVVHYTLTTEESSIDLNSWVGSKISIRSTGSIFCSNCTKRINKTYAGGYCFQCMQRLPQTDMCQMKPELCHFSRGTCRDEEYAHSFCFSPHRVYLARSSSVKVGITRENPPETRWMDQGAVEGMIIAEVPDRKTSGMIEIALAQHIHDKTDFRKMLRGDIAQDDLDEVFESIVDYVPLPYQSYLLSERRKVTISYPLRKHPEKIKTKGLEKVPELEGTLMGIKGQYLIFDDFVFNVRSHTGFEVLIEGEPCTTPPEESPPEDNDEPVSIFDFM